MNAMHMQARLRANLRVRAGLRMSADMLRLALR